MVGINLIKVCQVFISNKVLLETLPNKKYNCSRPWHLKVKEQDISLTKNYCITINIKIISSIHIFVFKIQVLGSHELKATAIFDKAHAKMIESSFSLPAFVLACKKISYFICSVLRYSQFQGPKTRLTTPIFDHAHPINF